MKRRILRALLLTLTIGGLFTGCGSENTSGKRTDLPKPGIGLPQHSPDSQRQ